MMLKREGNSSQCKIIAYDFAIMATIQQVWSVFSTHTLSMVPKVLKFAHLISCYILATSMQPKVRKSFSEGKCGGSALLARLNHTSS